jgi:hypothetical protein
VSPCFTTPEALSAWLFEGGRTAYPSYTDPVTVLIGTGVGEVFEGKIACYDSGHVTFRGVGPTRPTIRGTNPDPIYDFTIYSSNCDELAFENLIVEGAPNPTNGNGIAAYWYGDGDSRWVNVTLSANYAAWYDSSCSGEPTTAPPAGTHYVQDSTLIAGAIGWYGDCGEAVFYDSEITVTGEGSFPIPGGGPGFGPLIAGLRVSYRGEFYLVDTRVTVDATTLATPVKAVGLAAGFGGNGMPTGSGEVEMFGGHLTVKGSPDDTVYGAYTRKFSEVDEPATVRIQGTKLTLQNGTAPAEVTGGDGVTKRVDLSQTY